MPNLVASLERHGLELPEAPKPIASYVPATSVHAGHLVYVSGQLPTTQGKLIAEGTVPEPVSLELAQKCARLCVLNGLAALLGEIDDLDRLRRVVKLEGFIACNASFGDHSKVVNGASDLLVELLGEDGTHARAAVGVTSLPLNAPVEIAFTFLID